MRPVPKVGDNVKILMSIHGRYCLGKVIRFDGYDVYVRLRYKGVEVHRLHVEVKVIP